MPDKHSVCCRGQKVIYTTPLKALSNQKLFELRERFGTDRVGLATGDTSVQPDSPVMVMTTEILRNIMYRTEEEAAADDGAGIDRDDLADVGLVVLDEVSPACMQALQVRHLASLTLVMTCMGKRWERKEEG